MKTLVVLCALILAVSLCGAAKTQKERRKRSTQSAGSDCTQIKKHSPAAHSGVYMIQPAGTSAPFEVYCAMLPDGGWTVFQTRSGNAVSFQRNWAAYKNGFGNLNWDHWLGLKKVHQLTKGKKSTLRVDLWDHKGGTAYAEYKSFKVGSEKTAFKLHVGQYSGTAGDAIRGTYSGINQNGFGFSTSDRDNDGCKPCVFGDIIVSRCADPEGGGWWYSRCGSASLNGDYHRGGNHVGWSSGLHWLTWKGPAPYSAKRTRMMVKSE